MKKELISYQTDIDEFNYVRLSNRIDSCFTDDKLKSIINEGLTANVTSPFEGYKSGKITLGEHFGNPALESSFEKYMSQGGGYRIEERASLNIKIPLHYRSFGERQLSYYNGIRENLKESYGAMIKKISFSPNEDYSVQIKNTLS